MSAYFVLPDFLPALPEIFLLGMALVVLLISIGQKPIHRTLAFYLTQLTLLFVFVLVVGGSRTEAVYTFANMFVRDLFADFLKAMVCFSVMMTLAYSRRYLAERTAIPVGEYCALSLFATLGMMAMISANHFLPLYLGLEILSLSLYALTALNRSNAAASEAAMKYFVLGALASGFLLYGMSLIYGMTGSLNISEIAILVEYWKQNSEVMDSLPLVFGLVFIVAGLGFKMGAVPFHMWLPDVYHGAPTAATLFIAAAPKLAAFAMLARLLLGALFPLLPDWQPMLMLLAVLSMGLGNIVAVAQHNIKRMLAYSAISHMGFVLLALCSGLGTGEDPLTTMQLAYGSALFYLVAYVLATLAIFGLIMMLSRAGFESDRLEDFKGLNQRSPWLAALMMLLMLSLAGIPILVGFFAKFAVLTAVVLVGHYWLAVLAVMFSLIGAFYYLRVVKLMYFDEAPANAPPIEASVPIRILFSVNSLAILLIGIFPQTVTVICTYVADSLLFRIPLF
ncbi:MAG: NADH-quinone oxidoreductase subunit NuoN [Zoogloeaceae bacterium]|jgi:NADH-quinone oxidoreductase subunit N|nr:NADH-quinone oxidoreductase subunit NuoN [Zoogloeaceae bacterium]